MPNAEAWIYCAVSAGKQEATIEDQLAWGRQCALEHGWTVTREFGKDREGVGSGDKGARKILKELVDLLEKTPRARRPERVLMIHLDRLGRGDGLEPIEYFSKIKRMGVVIHTRMDGDHTVKNAMDAIRPVLELITGGLENERRRDKALAAHAKRKALGKSWHAPLGLTRNDQNFLEIDPETAPLVREAFTLRSQGWGYQSIAARLRKLSRARRWSRSFVLSMLERKAYRGLLIPEDLFDAVQGRPGQTYSARGKTIHPWPLAGALHCGICGHLLHGMAKGGQRQARIRYYVCDNIEAHDYRPHFRADDMEAQFIERLREIPVSPEATDAFERKPAEARSSLHTQVHALEAQLKDIDKKREFVWTMQPYTTEFEVGKRLEILRAEETELTGAIDQLKREITAAAATEVIMRDAQKLIAKMADTWAHLDVDDQQRAARAVGTAFRIIAVETDPNRIRGAKAKRKSATGRLEFCVHGFKHKWTQVTAQWTALVNA